jgi:hypothetical protein
MPLRKRQGLPMSSCSATWLSHALWTSPQTHTDRAHATGSDPAMTQWVWLTKGNVAISI